MFNFFATWGAYVWMFGSFYAMVIGGIMFSQTHKPYHFANAITWFCAGLYGMTYPAINVAWIAYINVSLFWIGCVTNVYAHTAKEIELYKLGRQKKLI